MIVSTSRPEPFDRLRRALVEGSRRFPRLVVIILAAVLSMIGLVAINPPARAQTNTVTNLAHLDFLLDEVSPAGVPGHTTYRLDSEPDLIMPWTYANARPGGGFQRVGGGDLVPGTGDYTQGAYNTDDITRAAVVYLRHWRQTGNADSRRKAYELLRSVAYMQTTSGANRGNPVLWIQADGELNPSAKPVELPDPSDSGPSYWLARTVWAYGEGYRAFRASDPAFARFLRDRMQLTLGALQRQVLNRYGRDVVVDGVRLPGWLIVNGADATAEAVLGLSAYVEAAPGDRAARRALGRFANGIAAMSAGDVDSWPYGAVLPWAESRSVWHAWGSQMSAALARSADALDRPRLLRPAVREMVGFDTTLLTAGGPDNGWLPTPSEQVQIAYGADSRVQSLLAVADVGRLRAGRDLAALAAAWFFGANRSGQPVYERSTGVTFDGVETDGRVNRNSGAESTIHGLLTMLALDDHPAVRARALAVNQVQSRSGLSVVEAETAVVTTGSVVTRADGWTGESRYGGSAYLELDRGETASLPLPAAAWPRVIEPVSWQEQRGLDRSSWRQGARPLGDLRHRVGAQGITAVPGALLPQNLDRLITRGGGPVVVRATAGTVDLDAMIIRPTVSSVILTGQGRTTELWHSAARQAERVTVSRNSVVRSYDARGELVEVRRATRQDSITLRPGGFLIIER